jgi:hypothetical protein
MNDAELAELKAAVERSTNCPATYRNSERVREHEREVEVALFDILGHPHALLCYAWSEPIAGSDRRRSRVVLREGPVHTSFDAVRRESEP